MAKKTKSSQHKNKPDIWFVPVRGSYLPASPAGWLTYLPFVAYLIFTIVVTIRNISSTAVAILFIVPNWIAAVVILTYIAARKS